MLYQYKLQILMGCCFQRPEEEEMEEPSKTKHKLHQNKSSNIHKQKINHKQQGNEHFKKQNYQQAIEAYEKALKQQETQLSLYTNLALCYRAQKQHGKSIQIIEKMFLLPNAIRPTDQDLTFVVKGQLLKARSQIFIVKQFCLNQEVEVGKGNQQINKKYQLIQRASKCLQELLRNPKTQTLAQQFKVQSYLETGSKVKKYFQTHFLSKEQQQTLLKYFKKRLSSRRAQETFMKVRDEFQRPESVIDYIAAIMTEQKKKNQEDEEEDFIMDPIFLEQFKQPFIVESGNTYEQQSIKEHFKKNGSNDPITHQEFNNELGVHNYTLKGYITQTRKLISKQDIRYLEY